MDWEEQRLELIEGLLARPSPSQPSLQEAVSVLLYMAQDDASSSGGDSPQVQYTLLHMSLRQVVTFLLYDHLCCVTHSLSMS